MSFDIKRCSFCSLLLALLLFGIASSNGSNEYKTVRTNSGPVRGRKLVTLFDGKPYYAFKGIPFAKPPIGNLRFKNVQEPDRWTEALDAFEYRERCPQMSRFDIFIGDEDCLYLNVFVPAKQIDGKFPIMNFIHGGGYYYGAGNIYGPDFLIDQDVIVVTSNYRLGILGYLSLGTPEYSGNMGMKDQQVVLRWIQENIEQFGGDREQVTIFGESAGGASVHLHTLSSTSAGLFKRAIMQSGSALTTWSHRAHSNNYLDELYQLSHDLGHNAKTNDELLRVFRNVDVGALIKTSNAKFYEFHLEDKREKMLWKPVVEVAGSKDAFINKLPEEYLSEKTNKNIDMLIGYTSGESLFLTTLDWGFPEYLKPFDDQFIFELPISRHVKPEVQKRLISEVREFFFPNGAKIDRATFAKYINLLDDFYFTYASHKSARMELQRNKNVNIYFYLFSVQTDLNVIRKIGGYGEYLNGVGHLEDLYYLFRFNDTKDYLCYYPYEDLQANTFEVKKIRDISKLWGDFAKYGTPSPNGPTIKPYTLQQKNFFNITNEGLVNGIDLDEDRYQFWDNLYTKYDKQMDAYFSSNVKDEL